MEYDRAVHPVATKTTKNTGPRFAMPKGVPAQNMNHVVRVNLPARVARTTHMVSSPVWSLTRIVMGSLPSGLASSASLILTNVTRSR